MRSIVNNLDLGIAYYAWKSDNNDLYYTDTSIVEIMQPVYSSSLSQIGTVYQINSDGSIVLFRSGGIYILLTRSPEDDIPKNLKFIWGKTGNYTLKKTSAASYVITVISPRAFVSTCYVGFVSKDGDASNFVGISDFSTTSFAIKAYNNSTNNTHTESYCYFLIGY